LGHPDFLGKFSGAHVNPAITLGFYIYEGRLIEGLPKLLLYWIGQFLGAFLGVIISRQFISTVVYVGVPVNQSVWDVVYGEFFFTGSFLFFILYVCSAITSPTKSGPINCAIIVAWFYVIVNAGSTISGAAYNPAILTMLNFVAYQTKDSTAINYLVYMISAELVGAIVFALIFKYIFEACWEKPQEKK